ncbi:hypothetical protein AMATHDRAFT_145051 [Amanita thiersii Skay4041]|uniref:BTB domain-containing protein n=1 Tax=Amanita thiersii Skay4041 TaxID=703135 RepID=A0A2A9NS06_9AGAR|nr:hypothetical protein AMATHDRAFT_145051 [Amanita thiersii Skay4041]
MNPLPIRDVDFYFEDIIFLVEDRLFKVPKHLFLKHSEIFRDTFSVPITEGAVPDGSSDEHPFSLEGITIREFSLFLRCLYPLDLSPTSFTLELEEWVSVLKLAKLYQIKEIVTLAVERMAPLLAEKPSLQIHLAKQYQITEWMLPGLSKLIQSDRALNEKDVELIGLSDALKAISLRETLRPGNSRCYNCSIQVGSTIQVQPKDITYQICTAFNFSLPVSTPSTKGSIKGKKGPSTSR